MLRRSSEVPQQVACVETFPYVRRHLGYTQFYARKIQFCFPETELIDSNNMSGAKEPRADVAQMLEGLSTCWGRLARREQSDGS